MDQQQTLSDARFAVLAETPSLAQTFTAGTSGMVDLVSLHVGCCADALGTIRGVPPGYGLMVEITDVDSSGVPPPAAPGVQRSTDMGSSIPANSVPMALCIGSTCPSSIVAGTRHAIRISVYSTVFDEDVVCGWDADLSLDCGYQWGRTTPSAYSAGDGLGFWGQGFVDGVYVPESWHREDRYDPSIAEYDLAFKTYITP